ncbi:homocysteine S-methyltransferase family protein [Aquiluna sp.]|nr:homocysteine S-methyltransferase family protein [Aquiluna sp.]MDA9099538.1 homocysteine S-methyltransferase family protein [Aquiluna sp.]
MTVSFQNRLEQAEPVILSGGYLFEVERRGYLKAGEFVPMVALEHPEVLEQVTTDFIRAGSDISLAFTYNGHREKMRIIGQEQLLEPLNRAALRIAKKVAEQESINLGRHIYVAGNISNSNIFDPNKPETADEVRLMFREMITWAKQEGADLILAETMYFLAEAEIALEEIQAAGLASIVNVAVFDTGKLMDGVSPAKACEKLAALGADVVGTNCFQGPNTIRPIFEAISESVGAHHTCAMPCAYRTTNEHTTLFSLPDTGNTAKLPSGRTFPDALEAQVANRYEAAEFAAFARNLGAKVIGLCCGASVVHHRAVAEQLGSESYLSQYSTDMSKHFLFGTDESLSEVTKSFGSTA